MNKAYRCTVRNFSTIRYDTIRYDSWFALENWQASCQFLLLPFKKCNKSFECWNCCPEYC